MVAQSLVLVHLPLLHVCQIVPLHWLLLFCACVQQSAQVVFLFLLSSLLLHATRARKAETIKTIFFITHSLPRACVPDAAGAYELRRRDLSGSAGFGNCFR